MKPKDKALRFLTTVMDSRFALTARNQTGDLLGVAGFKTANGAFVGGGLRNLADIYGWGGALWRGALLSVFERKVEKGVLLMDGIFVHDQARGRGVGTALLRAVKARAASDGLESVRLDVINTNPRARALYEREGFVAGQVTHMGPLRHLFGFASSVEMRADIA